MQSPFPGIDPYIENQEWEDFHTRWNTTISEFLSPRLEPRYVVRVERRVYVEHMTHEHAKWRRSDVAILTTDVNESLASSPNTATAVAPVECELPMPEERRETFLVVRDRETTEVVTVLETLSPFNKRPGSDGRREYLNKRESILESQSHLIELDLLRGGERLPSIDPIPDGDFFAIVSRRQRRPKAAVYGWSIRQSLPPIPVPLKGDEETVLELQSVFTTVFDRARYDLSIDYREEVFPPLAKVDAEWVQSCLNTINES